MWSSEFNIHTIPKAHKYTSVHFSWLFFRLGSLLLAQVYAFRERPFILIFFPYLYDYFFHELAHNDWLSDCSFAVRYCSLLSICITYDLVYFVKRQNRMSGGAFFGSRVLQIHLLGLSNSSQHVIELNAIWIAQAMKWVHEMRMIAARGINSSSLGCILAKRVKISCLILFIWETSCEIAGPAGIAESSQIWAQISSEFQWICRNNWIQFSSPISVFAKLVVRCSYFNGT